MVNKFFSIIFFSFLIFTGCSNDIQSHEKENKSELRQAQTTQTSSIINDFYAVGGGNCVTVNWAPISKEYKVFLMDGTDDEEIKKTSTAVQDGKLIEILAGTKSHSFLGLENAVSNEKEIKKVVYTYTLIVQDSDGNEIERQTAQATPAGEFEYEKNESGENETQNAWIFLSAADSPALQMASKEGFVRMEGSPNISNAQIAKIKCPKYTITAQTLSIFNNPAAVSKIVNDGKFTQSEEYKNLLNFLEDGEEIHWFTLMPIGDRIEVYGKIVKKSFDENDYTEGTDFSVETAISLLDEKRVFRIGTKIRTGGYYKSGDGGSAIYEISNRALYKYGSIKTAGSQWCNIQLQGNSLNLVALGGGNCFQIKWGEYEKWRKFQAAYNEYRTKWYNLPENSINKDEFKFFQEIMLRSKDSGVDSKKWNAFKAENPEQDGKRSWKDYILNNDADRIAEANSILAEKRASENEEITLFVPNGNYRIASDIKIILKNYVLRGNTTRREITPEQIDSFESTYAENADEAGSAASGIEGTIFYTDNGNCGTLNIMGPADNVLIEGITLESRELDSRRTFWHNPSDKDGVYTDINYVGRGSCEPTMADQQWFSRQVQISQCSNVTLKNCEFIITSHVRDKALYPSNPENPVDIYDFGDAEYLYETKGNLQVINTDSNLVGYQANAYVEHCDLHTDKQFTSVTFFDSWNNVTVDDCFLYNMSGVFRGASMGFLDMFGGQCNNGTVKNSTLYHNCHDEQIGIFTLTKNAVNYKESEKIDGVHFTGNKVYAMRDEHVDKAKPRTMTFTVGYDDSQNIYNVNISDNYFYAKDLPSKLFTFGGFVKDGRKNIVIQNNTIEMKDSGGVYMFETRPYVKILNNTINLNSSKGYIGGTIFCSSNTDTVSHIQPEFSGNTVNVNCTYIGSISSATETYSNGIAKGNTINISGDQSGTLFNGLNEFRENTINIHGRMKEIYSNSGTLYQDVKIDGNTLNFDFNDYEDEYTPGAEGTLFQNGREGFTFATISAKTGNDSNFFITSNKINAPNCTRMNKHFLRYTKTSVPVLISNNRAQKFNYLRGVSESNADKIVYLNNFDNYGKRLTKNDWYTDGLLNDTEKYLFCYDVQTDSYIAEKPFFTTGTIEIPKTYDDGNHGTKTVTIIEENFAAGKNLISDVKIPSSIKEIRSGAFNNCGLGKEIFIPSSVQKIGFEAFTNTSEYLKIKCEAPQRPAGWAENWYTGNAKIEWGAKN